MRAKLLVGRPGMIVEPLLVDLPGPVVRHVGHARSPAGESLGNPTAQGSVDRMHIEDDARALHDLYDIGGRDNHRLYRSIVDEDPQVRAITLQPPQWRDALMMPPNEADVVLGWRRRIVTESLDGRRIRQPGRAVEGVTAIAICDVDVRLVAPHPSVVERRVVRVVTPERNVIGADDLVRIELAVREIGRASCRERV